MEIKSNLPEWLKWDKESLESYNISSKKYKYVSGVKDIQVFFKEFEASSVYVSKPFIIDGNVVEVSLESSEFNQVINTPNKNINPFDTSIEYYVSFQENPIPEDWIPILPKGQSFIHNELLLFRNKSICQLRFPCDTSKEIIVYKNGVKLNKQFWSYSSNNTISIDSRFDKYATYTTQYFPNLDILSPWDIELKGDDRQILPYTSPDGTSGELFKNGTDRNGTILLSKYPYIDYDKVNRIEGYQPIEVVLENANISGPNRKIYTFIDGSTLPVKTKNVTDYKYLSEPYLTPYNFTIGNDNKMINPYFEYYQGGRRICFTETFNNSHIISNMQTNHGDSWVRIKYDYLRAKIRLKIILRNTSSKSKSLSPTIKDYNLIFKVMR